MLANFLGVLPILISPLCALTFSSYFNLRRLWMSCHLQPACVHVSINKSLMKLEVLQETHSCLWSPSLL
jgi:hypothetical protein